MAKAQQWETPQVWGVRGRSCVWTMLTLMRELEGAACTHDLALLERTNTAAHISLLDAHNKPEERELLPFSKYKPRVRCPVFPAPPLVSSELQQTPALRVGWSCFSLDRPSQANTRHSHVLSDIPQFGGHSQGGVMVALIWDSAIMEAALAPLWAPLLS